MYFAKATLLFSMGLSTALAVPIDDNGAHNNNNNNRALAARALTTQPYSAFQISDGVGGNCLAEVAAKFPIDETNLAAVSASDLSIIKAARVTAENAEVGTGGFNDALAAAGSGGNSTATQVGKIKNKCLKLKLETLALQIEAAQGASNAAKLAQEQTKLDKNVAIDKTNAGKPSQSVNFAG